jgi:ribonuclease P protein component
VNETSFKRDKRLTEARDYQFVFADAKRYGDKSLTLLVRKNEVQQEARLGLAISKKCAKRAVDRNRIKRLIRESFRLQHKNLPAIDIIVMCKPSILSLDNESLRKALDKQWDYIAKKQKQQSS